MKTFLLTPIVASALLMSGCMGAAQSLGSTGTTTGSTGSSGTGSGSTGNVTALPAVFSKFKTGDHTCSSSVTVTLSGNYVVITSNGIPNHGSPYFTGSCYEKDSDPGFKINPNTIVTQNLIFKIPVSPASAATKTATPGGPIGVSINGVPFFNQYAAMRSPLTSEKVSFDQYGGHPQQDGQYHYHVEPKGLTQSDGSDALLGFLLDGFPVYGPMENGALVSESSLDEYHGHTSVTADYPGGIYHYHVTANDPYINGSGFYGTPGTVSD